MTQNLYANEFSIIFDYLNHPERFTNQKNPQFWEKYRHGLYLSEPNHEGQRFYYLPISHYMNPGYIGYEGYFLDDSDDEPDETVIPLLNRHHDDTFKHAALCYHDQVYLHVDSIDKSSNIQRYINQQQQQFVLKSSQYERYKVKPLNYANSNVYFGDYFFRDREMFLLMRFVGENLYKFLDINPHLPKEMIEKIIEKIIQLVINMHDKSIVHTDLKLENICIEIDSEDEPNLNLIDFDDAIMPEFNDRMSTVLPGTFTFYAPEIFKYLPESIRHFSSFMAFQELAFFIIQKTATLSHEMNIQHASSEKCDICIFPDNKTGETIHNLHQLSPAKFMEIFIDENYHEIFGIETDLFALGCIINLLLNHLSTPEQSPYHETMKDLLSYDPYMRRIF